MKIKDAKKIAKKIIRNDFGTLYYWYEKGYSDWDNLSKAEKIIVEDQIYKIIRQFEKYIKE